MSTVSGSCSVNKVSGMLYVREDSTPSVLEWNAIDQSKTIRVPLNSLAKLQESTEKLMLRVIYKPNGETEKKLTFSFTNRPTMGNVKETLSTIVARHKTVIKDSPAPGTPNTPGSSSNGEADFRDNNAAVSGSGSSLQFTSASSLSDESLLKNHQLQQRLLLDDRDLRNIFTQSVIKFKLSPNVFWSSRLNHLRTYALTISQHRGPYNVLSTIKPVASSDNQVNVNVTRDTINEMFETYPLIKKAYDDLVPHKFSEGEFWSRFFNSKLFRRLRGDKTNGLNDRGDVVLDKYLYIDSRYLEKENDENGRKRQKTGEEGAQDDDIHLSKFIDLKGNEEDNSQKLGNMPDLTMRFTEESTNQNSILNNSRSGKNAIKDQENEMMILMKNMNNLSSKMVRMSYGDEKVDKESESLVDEELREYEEELNLHDLNEVEDQQYARLNINSTFQRKKNDIMDHKASPAEISNYFNHNLFDRSSGPVNLNDTYALKRDEIDNTGAEVAQLIKQNFRAYRMSNSAASKSNNSIISESTFQEIITFNITITEFLSHFWNSFLDGSNPGQTKKLFANLKNCKSGINTLKHSITESLNGVPILKTNEKLKDKIVKDLNACISPMENSIDQACTEYIKAVKEAQSATNTASASS